MCGNKLEDSDHYCQYCGAPTGPGESVPGPEESPDSKEEIVFNPPYANKSYFAEEETASGKEEISEPSEEKEDLKTYISEDEIEAHKQEETSAEQAEVKNREFVWNVHEFPSAKKKESESVEFNWNMEAFGRQEEKVPQTAAFEEELFREISDESSRIREQNIDRFFTFSRKNEEFQKLLDREYEKFRKHFGSEEAAAEDGEAESSPPAQTQAEPKAEPLPEEVRHEELSFDGGSHSELEVPEAQETAEVQKTSENAEVQKIPENAEVHKTPEVSEVQKTPEAQEVQETSEAQETAEILEAQKLLEASEVSEAPHEKPKAEHLSEMAQARKQFFGKDLLRDNDSIKKALVVEEPESDETRDLYEPPPSEEDSPGNVLFEEEPKEEEIPKEVKEPETAAPSLEVALAEMWPSDPEHSAEAAEESEEKERSRVSLGQIALIIIAIILAIEIIILGIRFFAPESAAAQAIREAQTGIFKTVSDWSEGISDLFSGKDADKDGETNGGKNIDQDNGGTVKPDGEQQPADDGVKAPAPDPNPMSDKNALVTSQLGNNKNIEQVKANEALVYRQGTDYGQTDINNSKPIVNNIWQTPENGEPVYYDKSVVGAIIAFDSQWIDYVNGGSKSVMELVKKDSKAYQNAVSFSKIGKIKETFKLLEIGEIRQGANGFYVWVHEEIQITEKGKTADKKYNWIYYLEPTDGKMQIVNYFKFQ
jgi:hypothetical protein